MDYRLEDLCRRLNLSYTGNGKTVLKRVCGIDEIGTRANGLAYFVNPEELKNLPVPDGIFGGLADDPETIGVHSQSALILPESCRCQTSKNLIFAADPLAVHVEATRLLHPPCFASRTVSSEASIGKNVKLGKGVTIDPKVVIYDDVSIGSDTVVRAGSVIMERSSVGEGTLIHPNVSILADCKIGNRVILHSNVVIGSDGFGYYQREGKNIKIPQIGGVVIEDNVEIGAGSTIDRAKFYDTIVRKGSKLDNLVHIAHNVEVGEQALIAAQSGIAGSTHTGRHLIMAGQTGIKDNLRIGDHVTLLLRATATSDAKSHSVLAGMPARPYERWRRIQATVNRIDKLAKRVGQLEKSIDRLLRTKSHNK